MEKEKREKQQFLLLSKRKRNLRFICFPARSTAQKKKNTAPQNYLLPIFKQELEVFVFVFTAPWRGRYTNSSPPLTTSRRRRRSRIMRRCPLTLRQKRKKTPSPSPPLATGQANKPEKNSKYLSAGDAKRISPSVGK